LLSVRVSVGNLEFQVSRLKFDFVSALMRRSVDALATPPLQIFDILTL
jgi:hypothetical protein